jgi:hypothetical protein
MFQLHLKHRLRTDAEILGASDGAWCTTLYPIFIGLFALHSSATVQQPPLTIR